MRHLRFNLATALMLGVILASFSALAVGLYERAQRTNESRTILCQSVNRANGALRDILLLAQQVSAENPDLTQEQRERAREFYRQALARVRLVDCSEL